MHRLSLSSTGGRVSFTLDTYAHLIPSMERAGAEQIDRLFTTILKPKTDTGTPGALLKGKKKQAKVLKKV